MDLIALRYVFSTYLRREEKMNFKKNHFFAAFLLSQWGNEKNAQFRYLES